MNASKFSWILYRNYILLFPLFFHLKLMFIKQSVRDVVKQFSITWKILESGKKIIWDKDVVGIISGVDRKNWAIAWPDRTVSGQGGKGPLNHCVTVDININRIIGRKLGAGLLPLALQLLMSFFVAQITDVKNRIVDYENNNGWIIDCHFIILYLNLRVP